MAKVELSSLIDRIKAKFSETPTDEELTLLEDITDTFNGSADGQNSGEDWKAKYDELDKSWRKRYADRFNGKLEDNPVAKEVKETETAETITIDDLFTEGE